MLVKRISDNDIVGIKIPNGFRSSIGTDSVYKSNTLGFNILATSADFVQGGHQVRIDNEYFETFIHNLKQIDPTWSDVTITPTATRQGDVLYVPCPLANTADSSGIATKYFWLRADVVIQRLRATQKAKKAIDDYPEIFFGYDDEDLWEEIPSNIKLANMHDYILKLQKDKKKKDQDEIQKEIDKITPFDI